MNEIVKLENNILYSINYDGENFTAYYVSVTFNPKYGRLEVNFVTNEEKPISFHLPLLFGTYIEEI